MSQIDPELLEILCCPETKQTLRVLDAAVVETLNAKVSDGLLHNRGGLPIKETMESALVVEDGRWCYPVRNGIPIMLVEEAIPLR